MTTRIRSLTALFLSMAILATLSVGCADERGDDPRTSAGDTLPSAALTERGQRDSARVARLVVAYFGALSEDRLGDARALFFPESLLVATPDGGVELEGRSSDMERQLAADASASPVRRIEILRRANTELLDNTYRETWIVQWIPEAADSARQLRRIHVLQQLGDDARWLGRMSARE